MNFQWRSGVRYVLGAIMLMGMSRPVQGEEKVSTEVEGILKSLGQEGPDGARAHLVLSELQDKLEKSVLMSLKNWAKRDRKAALTFERAMMFDDIILSTSYFGSAEITDALLDCLDFKFATGAATGGGPTYADSQIRPELEHPAAIVLLHRIPSDVGSAILRRVDAGWYNDLSKELKKVVCRIWIRSHGGRPAGLKALESMRADLLSNDPKNDVGKLDNFIKGVRDCPAAEDNHGVDTEETQNKK